MKRRLIILRHGAAVLATPGVPDRERPLEERGRAQCLEVAADLLRLGWIPDLALVSAARRTRETWRVVAEHLDRPVPTEETAALYGTGWDVFREVVGAQNPDRRCLVVVGHNPGLEEVVATATGLSLSLGTGHTALLAGEGRSWLGALREGRWQLVARTAPSA